MVCCNCGKPANLDIVVDHTGRMACTKDCRDKLNGAGLPPEKASWFCNTHGKNNGR